MIALWHTLLHGGAAAILLAIGIPFLVLSARTTHWRPRRMSVRPPRVTRPALFAAVAILAAGGLTFAVFWAARTADAPAAAAISTLAAALGAVGIHAARRGSFNNVATVPLAGMVAIGMLLTIAGPQAPADHGHDQSTVEQAHHHD